ncbi:MAG: MFS transporter [Bacteroidota bacterium]
MSTIPVVPLNDKRMINAWSIFDWANSAFALVITVAIFPAYYINVTFNEVDLFGMQLSNSALYAFAISFAYLLLAIVSPLLSGIADYGGKKKFFLKLFTYMGAGGCLTLFLFDGMQEGASDAYNLSQLLLGTIAFVVGLIGYAGALVFYNSYLPEIATEDRYDSVSAKGFAYGYIGSVILLVANLVVIMNPHWFGITDDGLAVRIAFLMVGVWWIGFSLIPFRVLPDDSKEKPQENLMRKGTEELLKVWHFIRTQVNMKYFLLSFLFYSAGAQTVLFMASTFAEKELAFSTQQMIGIILVLQFLAIVGAYLFAKVSDRWGNRISLVVILLVWMLICFVSYFVQEQGHFYTIAAAVGLVMGGVQALSRSTYSKLLPEKTEDTTSFFSMYDVLEKVAIIGGTFLFGFLDQITGDMRVSLLALGIFFIVGIILLMRVKVQAAEGSINDPQPAA